MIEPRGNRSWRRRDRKAGLNYGATVSRWNFRCDRSQCGRRRRNDAPTNGQPSARKGKRTDDEMSKRRRTEERRTERRYISLDM